MVVSYTMLISIASANTRNAGLDCPETVKMSTKHLPTVVGDEEFGAAILKAMKSSL